MIKRKSKFSTLALILFAALLPASATAQTALTDDAYTKSASNSSGTNFGANPNLTVSSVTTIYIKFKLSSTLPAGTSNTDVSKATLKLYIGNVNAAGKIDVYQVAGPWQEAAVTADNAPPLGALVTTTAQIGVDRKGQFLVLDVTPAVQQWLGDDGSGANGAPNYGLALAAHPVDATTPALVDITFDSKENSQTSHEAQLHVALHAAGGLSAVEHDQTLEGDGTSSAPLGVADAGVANAHLADGAVTSAKIASGQVVRSLNALTDDVTLAAGSNVTITPAGNTLTVAATGLLGAVAHDQTLAGEGTAGAPLGIADQGVGTTQLAHGAVTSPKIAAPLALASTDPDFTLSVANNGGGTALTAAGPINTSTQYNLGGKRVLSATASGNTFAGHDSGTSNTNGFSNSYFGGFAGHSNTEGGANSFFGYSAGRYNSTAHHNSFFGYQAGALNTTGGSNSFFGSSAGQANTGGSRNSFFGTAAGLHSTSGDNNSFFGNSAGLNNISGNNNSFFGWQAGGGNTTGAGNSFFGTNAGLANTDGFDNAFLGRSSGQSNTSGFVNSFFGANAGLANTTGTHNTFVGFGAGFNNTSGAGNTFVGIQSGFSNTVEHSNTFVGGFANGAAGITNATAVGYNALVTQSNSLVLGNEFVNVGIGGASAPKARLHVQGGDILLSTPGRGVILKSPDGATCRLLAIDNTGALSLSAVACT